MECVIFVLMMPPGDEEIMAAYPLVGNISAEAMSFAR
jgi:hypothetical protein